MSGIHAEAERLPSGMEAVFIHQPHWQTSSARLIVNAGGLHESPTTPFGVAHFFEHVTFQGTQAFPSIEALEEYRGDHFAYMNAGTAKNQTTYIADTPRDLSTALHIVTQLALFPTLAEETIERERGPIIDEARAFQYDPLEQVSRRQAELIGGERFAAVGTGTIEEVAAISHADILDFYNKHYRVANMLLVVCSGDQIEVQREKSIAATSAHSPALHNPEPTLWHLPWFKDNPGFVGTHVDLPLESQTRIGVNYALPENSTIEETMRFKIASGLLGQIAFRRLRRELAVAYHASSTTQRLINDNYGASEQYGFAYTETSTAATEAFQCIDELVNVVPKLAMTEKRLIEKTLESATYHLRAELEQTPSSIAGSVYTNLMFQHHRVIDPKKMLAVVNNIKVSDVQESVKELVESPTLVQVISPDLTIANQIYT